jgi:hypothetical protein
MEKAKFIYKKEDGSVSDRELLRPVFLKESSNSIKNFDKEDVKYVRGFELKKEGLNNSEIEKYEEILEDYYDLGIPTIQEFFKEQGLDSTRLSEKSFKKQNISNFQVL